MKTGIKVGDAMTKEPVVVSPEVSVKDCAKKMLKEKVGGVIVKKDNILLGIVTEKDIVEKAVAKARNPEKIKVKNIMAKKMVTIEPSKDLYDALIKMRDKNVRRLPVVTNKKLIGLLTEKDVLKIEPQLFDLLTEKFRLREESLKPIKGRYVEGECENCGNYAQLYNVGGKLLCEECKDIVR